MQKEIGDFSVTAKNGRSSSNIYEAPTDWPLISVIIPTYNNAQYLPTAIDSVLAQNYPAVELIIVDDGSTDDTPSVLATYPDQLCVIYQKNGGSAAARNAGIAIANGELIVFLDADDYLLPNKLHTQASRLMNDTELGMIHSGWLLVNEAGEQVGQETPWQDAPQLDIEGWLRVKPIKLGAMMYRRSWLQQVGGFDPDLRQSQDSDLLLRLTLEGCTTEWLRESTLAYRVYPNSTIRRNAPAQYRYLMRVHEKAFAHPQMPPDLKAMETTYRYFTLRWVVWHIFSEGFVDDLNAPLADLANSSWYGAEETVFDLLLYLAKQLLGGKRPFNQLHAIQPAIQAALPISETAWESILRFVNVIYQTATFDQLTEKAHTVWQYWQTTLAVQDAATPEQKLRFLLGVWEPFVVEKRPLSPTAPHIATLTPSQLIAAGQHALVQRYQPLAVGEITAVWHTANSSLETPSTTDAGLIAWLLTLAGQANFRRQRSHAARTFTHAIVQTLRSPSGIGAWRTFLNNGFNYFRDNQLM